MSEQDNNKQAEPTPFVAPELKAEHDRLMNIVRGNERRERRLQEQYRLMIDLGSVIGMRVNMLIEAVLGKPEHDQERLEFEIQFAEGMRSMLDQTLIQAGVQQAQNEGQQAARQAMSKLVIPGRT